MNNWNDKCDVYQLFDVLGKKWSIFIIFVIKKGYHHYNEILKVLKRLNSKVLAERLKTLESFGLIEKKEDVKSGKIGYFLTHKGEKVSENILTLSNFNDSYSCK